MTASNEITPTLDGDPNKGAYEPKGGEDEGSAPNGTDDSHLHEDQKPINGTTKKADEAGNDDPHKVEKLTKAGRDIDPDEGSD